MRYKAQRLLVAIPGLHTPGKRAAEADTARDRKKFFCLAANVRSPAKIGLSPSIAVKMLKSPKMRILFLHGWHSVVGGVKPTFLRDAGHEVRNPGLDDDDFEEAVRTAQNQFDQHRPDVVVGSSRGGAVAMNMESNDTPLVLLCPAWKNWGNATKIKPNTIILHSRQDDVIPFSDSEVLISNSGLRCEALIEIGNDHRLADDESLSVMLWACQLLSSGEQVPSIDDNPPPALTNPAVSEASAMGEACYICDACSEEIVIPIDITEGSIQSYVEDCPVCCRANMIHVHIKDDGTAQPWAEPEQDSH
jgi:Cysteine-rich CPXCG